LIKNGVDKLMHADRSGSSASNGSNASGDEDGDDAKTGKSQSRIDKWKAKHEAMLKLAQKTEKKSEVPAANAAADSEPLMPAEEKNSEILNLDPSAGVCIDFDAKDVARGRHALQQHQVLSV
jgi:hypothetical protein